MRTLIVVDLQNDFLPGGALAVPEGDEVIAVANAAMPRYELVVATRDWHPPAHISFVSQHPGKQVGEVIELDELEQILWPDHCIRGSQGAAFPTNLQTAGLDHIVSKGIDPARDSYSGFFDNGHRHETGLAGLLRGAGAQELDVIGLATAVCVQATLLDALSLGFPTRLILAGVRGVDRQAGDSQRAIAAMQAAGAILCEDLAAAERS